MTRRQKTYFYILDSIVLFVPIELIIADVRSLDFWGLVLNIGVGVSAGTVFGLMAALVAYLVRKRLDQIKEEETKKREAK